MWNLLKPPLKDFFIPDNCVYRISIISIWLFFYSFRLSTDTPLCSLCVVFLPPRPVNILIIVISKSLSDGCNIQVIFKSGFHFRMPSGPFFFFFFKKLVHPEWGNYSMEGE